MTSPEPTDAAAHLATSAADYDERYYKTGLGPPYEESEPHWAQFFGRVAADLVALTAPRTSLDAGCAKGFLVKALLDAGVDAHGVDVSEYAIREAAGAVRDRVGVHNLTKPLGRTYDLVTCIEVLEHMAPADAEKAIDNLCAASDLVLVSSTPHDFAESTHVNVRPVAEWVASFARRGFFRKPGADMSSLSPWAVLLERRSLTAAEVARMYEAEMAPLREEAVVKAQALLEVQRQLDAVSAGGPPLPGGSLQLDRVLGLVDQVIGLQAELAELRYETDVDGRSVTGADRPALWLGGESRPALEAELARERELRQALQRRLADAGPGSGPGGGSSGSIPAGARRAAAVARSAARAGRRALRR